MKRSAYLRDADFWARAARHPLVFLWEFNRPYWSRYAWGAVWALGYTAVSLAMPFLFRALVSDFDNGVMDRGRLWCYFGLLVGVAVAGALFRYFQRMLMIGASRLFEYELRNQFFGHVLRMPPAFLHRYQTGDIMARATNDLNYVRDFTGPGVMGAVDMLQIPLMLGSMVYLSPKLTLLMAIPLPIVSVMVYGFVRFMQKHSRIVQELFSGVTSRAQENLAGARVVKAYGIADREQRDFLTTSQVYMQANLKLAVVSSMAWPLIGTFIGGVILLVIWQGGDLVIRGKLTIADLTGFLLCLMAIVWPLAQFGWILTLYQRGVVSMERLIQVLRETPDIADGADTRPGAQIVSGAIRFEDVSFDYRGGDSPSETGALRRVSLEVPAGRCLAIVGPTGSGKSTLVSLLAREYDAGAGRILVDGQDIRTVPLKVLRSAMGVVPQDTFIFSESILENVRLGKPEAPMEAVRRACKIAQFEEALADMPEGMDTLLGERGINLSGGQKQRLALARAVLCDPVILVLDDALSSVDTHTEERILEGLGEVMSNRTSIVISHRISSIRHAHEIVVLDEGRVAEHGTHEQLLGLDGLYARMYRRQLLETALEDGLPVEAGECEA